MCGRFGLSRRDVEADPIVPEADPMPRAEWRRRMAALNADERRPTDPVVAVRTAPSGPRLTVLRWGLIPRWARDVKQAGATFNARAETVSDRPAFRDPWRAGQRCIVLADTFTEWAPALAPGTRKRPHTIARANGGRLYLAGLWEAWRDPADPDAAPVGSCTILTCAPNATVGPLHDRMPVVLDLAQAQRWLDARSTPAVAAALCQPCADDVLQAAPQNGAEALAPV